MFTLKRYFFSTLKLHSFENLFRQAPRRTQYISSLYCQYSKNAVDSIESDAREEMEYPYKIINPYDPQLTKLMVASKSRKARYKTKTIMLEGKRLITDALVAGLTPLMILFTRKQLIKDLPLLNEYVTEEKTVLRKIPYQFLQNWSNLTTCPGITGLFKMPNLEGKVVDIPTLPITLICDNIREPGNLGAILRIAAALPVQRVLLLTGCVDLWDTKVTRSSCGAMFHLQIANNVTWEDVRDTCSGNVILSDHLIENEQFELQAEDYSGVELDEAENNNEDDEDIVERKLWRQKNAIPVVPYHKIDYRRYNSFNIVVGGETEGLSLESFVFAKKNKGVRVNIPLAECVNSLNAPAAVGILTFEIKRQLIVD